ncbi:MAG: asparagine synthase (glutamine-hydrolyzing) [Gemmatimonadales bacterium]
MCGIAGIALADPSGDCTGRLERLTGRLQHRGPDGVGFRYLRGRSIGLGHRRLSIVDLATGAQPIGNEDGTVWITFNGEIYNHLELRRELEALGHRYRTRSDTESIVHGWEEWGPAVLERLNGIYAFGLFDGRGPGELWVARDPAGVKPLYVGHGDGGWWFASELRAAREAGLVEHGLRQDAISEFLVYRFIPSPGTPFNRVWKVPPGHRAALRLPAGEPGFLPFPTRFAPPALPRSAEEWREAVRDTLRGAVGRQLMSDVPVGSLLSGGVDSTVVTRLMRDDLPAPPQTFAIGFAGPGEHAELPLARRAAAALNVPLREIEVTEAGYRAEWSAHFGRFGEPVANPGVLLVGLLCRVVRETHKVVLSGQGADEPLGGYPRHAGERWYRGLRPFRGLLGLLPERAARSDRIDRVRRVMGETDEARRFAQLLAVFSPEAAGAMARHTVDPEALIAPVRDRLPANGDDTLNRLLAVDARLSLADDLLLVADQMSMASSVELRVPFLDLELLGLVERMPSRYKVSLKGERKWLYREAVRGLLPETLRPALAGWRGRLGAKLGFSAPVDRWLAEWAELEGAEFLLSPQACLPDLLRVEEMGRILDDVVRRHRPRGRQLLSLFALESWLRGVLTPSPAL